MSFVLRAALFCLLSVALPLFSPLASAQQTDEVILNETHLEGFIGVMPELQAIAAEHEADDDIDTLASDAVSAIARTQQTMAKLNDVLAKNGFEDVAEWGAVATSIAMAYNWLNEADDPEQILRAQIAELEADTQIDAERKAPMIAELEQQLEMIDELKPPAQNLELVARYRDKIAAVLEQ